MRVLQVGKYYPPEPGGIEQVVQRLCEGERSRVETHALVVNRSRATVHERVNGVPVTRVGSMAQVGSVGVSPTFPWWLRRLAGDIAVIHEPNPLAACSYLAARPRGRLIVWLHAEIVRAAWKYRLFYRHWQRAVFERADRIVVASPAIRDHARELDGMRDKCVVVPYGIDIDRLTPSDAVRGRASHLRRRHPAGTILFVGRLVPYKGVDVLLRALHAVDAAAVVVGEGPQRAQLEALSRDLGLEHRVEFVGAVDDDELVARYHACDLFVLPSVTKAEAFGLVQLEAMACGKPVICTSVPSGVPWVNQHRRTGLVVPPGDSRALSSAITELLAQEGARRAMGAQARLRVTQEFTVQMMVRRMFAVYDELAPVGATSQPARAFAGHRAGGRG